MNSCTQTYEHCERTVNFGCGFFIHTLPQMKRKFNFQIFHNEPGPGSVTPGHVHQGKFGPKFTDLHSSPKERHLQKSCVSFGEGCIVYKNKCKSNGEIEYTIKKNFTSLYTLPKQKHNSSMVHSLGAHC